MNIFNEIKSTNLSIKYSFDSATTHHTDYKPWTVQPIQTHRPNEYKTNTSEMDLNTIVMSSLYKRLLFIKKEKKENE